MLRYWFALTLVLTTFVIPASAQEAESKKQAAPTPPVIAQWNRKTEGLGLSEKQSQQVKAIAEAYAEKLQALNVKGRVALTEDQKKARADVAAKIKAKGLEGKEAAEALKAAAPLTAEQLKVQEEVASERKALMSKLNDEMLAVLTEDQKANLKPAAKTPAEKPQKPEVKKEAKPGVKKEAPAKKDAPAKEAAIKKPENPKAIKEAKPEPKKEAPAKKPAE